ncbi:MAG: glycosyltransferase family 4 protein [Actinomycetota bacterium]|nr:glycosyltransferase family 4 protein [Actinomycetota bacterium]
MNAGLPVIATRTIGAEEVVVHERTGLLVPPRDAQALGEAVGRLFADPALAARYAEAGRRRYQQHFTGRRMAADTLAVYRAAQDPGVHPPHRVDGSSQCADEACARTAARRARMPVAGPHSLPDW